ncbi:MAG: apolipoprotein N-acyltransferase [Elusimicrobia bacterium]|nr:apolipoprotein N-acyltransferase [Elusimicrobiota bacterium]
MVPALVWLLNPENQAGYKKIFGNFFLGGFTSYLIILYWIYGVLYLNGAGFFGAMAGYLALAAYLAIYWGLFGVLLHYMRAVGTLPLMFFIPLLWTGLELIKTYLFTGFPWLLTGYSLWSYTPLIQISSVTGVLGLSFLVLFLNAGVALFIRERKFFALAIPLLATTIVSIYGFYKISNTDEEGDYKAAILQGNISQYLKWDSEQEGETLRIYRDLAIQAAEEKPDLIVLPETVLPSALEVDPYTTFYTRRIAETTSAPLILGSVELSRRKYYNSAYSISPDGEISVPYRKIHLVPFGEYIPFRSILSNFIGVINEIGDFDPGEERILLNAKNMKFATAICFESIFGGEVSCFFREGAEVFVNITNDGWFLDTAGPYQHFIHSIFRSVENRTYSLRSANTGISAIIDPAGRILNKTKLLEETYITGNFSPSKKRTFYSRCGDLFAYFSLSGALAMIIWRILCIKNIKKN